MSATCKYCEQEMAVGNGCTCQLVITRGGILERVTYYDRSGDGHVCHDCNVDEGQYHHPGCDMEECPNCGGQLISCPCGINWLPGVEVCHKPEELS